ncbi:thioredoxin family protein [Paucibacter sp. M5-1]|uniref:thioredoxin family protein n=1 Tax=Paucibacter sp. M5-1 TaxID=3015998 RepID=UPI0022B92E50|nr:thioredoxin family protein [Paucibacter sp. M5-1]MCZ7880197.1 thioredoxin family protein [Paucibacter sp. M5-1]
MKISRKTWIATLLSAASLAQAAAVVGQPAPAFSISDSQGKTVSLADYKGKHVVLEWINPGCPFVKKHYDSGNMPATQKSAADKGVVWLAVSSTAKSASDYLPPPQLEAWLTSKQAAPKATLMDDDGKLGRAYGARTTPHMYVIDPAGTLVYAGAIDSKPTANPADIKTATNYVSQALGETLAGKPVSRPNSTAYGCTIKYAS